MFSVDSCALVVLRGGPSVKALCWSFRASWISREHSGHRAKHVKSRENDGVPLWTRYVRTKRALYEVRPVEQVIFVPHLVVPPAFNEPGPAREYRVLNEDVYGNF